METYNSPTLTLPLLVLLATSAAASVLNDSTISDVNIDPEGYTLNHTVILSRHSIRAPTYIDNAVLKEVAFPLGLGYSTALGNKFSLKVGEIWRQFYGDFVKNTNIRQTWIRSSSYDRCAETQQLVLGKMFPPEGDFYFGYPIQPIVAIKLPEGNDVNVENCGVQAPVSLPQLNNLTDPALLEDGFATFGDFVKFVTAKSGYDSDETLYFKPVIDAIYCAKFDRQPIPKWAEEKWSSIDFGMRLLSNEYWSNNIPYSGNYIGKFLAERLLTFNDGPHTHRFSFLSYHDLNIQAVLKALGNDPIELYPSFLGALHLQVYERNSDGKFFVRAMYHQGATTELEYRKAKEIKLASCPFPECTLEDLAQILSHIYDDVDRSRCPTVDSKALL